MPDIDKTEDEVRQAVLNKMQLDIDRLEEFNGRQRASKPPARPTKNGSGWLLGSGLIGHSQKMTVAASATAEKKTVGQRS